MLNQIAALGAEVLEKWKAADYSGEAFVEISRLALEKSRLHESYSTAEVARWLGSTPSFPEQFILQNPFGDPPLTLYMDPERRMAIEVYYWLHTDTSTHDHSFAGACTVLQGKSLHVARKFDVAKGDSGELIVGEMSRAEATLLQAGDVFPISSGKGFVHQVCHLSEPTVSLVLRTTCDWDVTQKDYYPPYYSLPPGGLAESRHALSRRMLATLRATEPALAESFERGVSERHDPVSAFLALRDQLYLAADSPTQMEIVRRVEDRYPTELPGLCAVMVRWASHSRLVFEVGEEARLLAALILNFGFGEVMYRVLRAYRPADALGPRLTKGLNEILAGRPLNPRVLQYALSILQNDPAGEESRLSEMDREIARLWNVSALEGAQFA